jgi:hypothetical protein
VLARHGLAPLEILAITDLVLSLDSNTKDSMEPGTPFGRYDELPGSGSVQCPNSTTEHLECTQLPDR